MKTPFSWLRTILATSLVLSLVVTCRDNEVRRDVYNYKTDPHFVSLERAQKVARNLPERVNFVQQEKKNGKSFRATLSINSSQTVTAANGNPVYYTFAYNGGGWSIISADDRLMPILAYSDNESFPVTPEKKSPGLKMWEEFTATQVEKARTSKDSELDPSVVAATSGEWATLEDDCIPDPNNRVACDNGYDPNTFLYDVLVDQLTTSLWTQECNQYNDLLPAGPNNRWQTCYKMYAGCVAVAVSQIVWYWQYGSAYNWSSMHFNDGGGDTKVLIRDAAYALNTSFSDVSPGSGAHVDPYASGSPGVESVFKNYFGYSSANYSNSFNWSAMVSSLSGSRPNLIAGCTSGNECHAWVNDGYHLFVFVGYTSITWHFNWGWGGMAGNGWYSFYSWNPGPQGGGINSDLSNHDIQVVTNIHP